MMRPVSQLIDLGGRAALITGAAGHIGKAIAEALALQGAAICAVDVDEPGCHSLARKLNELHAGSAVGISCDLKDEKSVRSAVKEAIAQMRRLDILIHCAAYVGTTRTPGWAVPFEEQTVEAWEAAIKVNLTSAFVMAQETRVALAESGHGSVILFGSTYGIVGPDNRLYEGTTMVQPAGYAASKGGLLQLMRYLATTFAPQIRVNAITPGGVWRNQPESFHQRYIERMPLRRMATEQDLIGAAVYLASDLSEYVTGQNLVVDGGWTAW